MIAHTHAGVNAGSGDSSPFSVSNILSVDACAECVCNFRVDFFDITTFFCATLFSLLKMCYYVLAVVDAFPLYFFSVNLALLLATFEEKYFFGVII